MTARVDWLVDWWIDGWSGWGRKHERYNKRVEWRATEWFETPRTPYLFMARMTPSRDLAGT
jgi:hypothetical protein